jgi:hypothetical protein
MTLTYSFDDCVMLGMIRLMGNHIEQTEFRLHGQTGRSGLDELIPHNDYQTLNTLTVL